VRVVPALPSQATTQSSRVFEDDGTIIVDHRRDCGRSDKPGKQEVVKLAGERELPAFVDDATVFMNGWHFTYFDDDHNVQSFMGVIANIRLENNRLTWEALGAIEEDDFDAPYEFCYTYTIVAWNRRSLDLVSSNREQPSIFSDAGDDHPITNYTVEGKITRDGPEAPSFNTALIPLSSYVFDEALLGKSKTALLLRGFHVWWRACGLILGCDHNLLQFAYSVDHSDAFIERDRSYLQLPPPTLPSPAHYVGAGFTSWDTHLIMKDNNARQTWHAIEELVSAVAGDDVRVVQPPFTVVPEEDVRFWEGCLATEGGVRTEDVTVEGLPFDYAIPVLSGWNVRYACDDENVKTIGVWLEPESVTYEKKPDESTGTLRYQVASVLHDRSQSPGHLAAYKVNVIGLNARVPADVVPALVPGSDGFCATDREGRLLVAVANAGVGDAVASVARVRFAGGETVDRPTPAVRGGQTAVLEPIVIPLTCPGDCGFTIVVDSGDTVLETDEGNNSVEGLCVG
jgi:hypothetical protein